MPVPEIASVIEFAHFHGKMDARRLIATLLVIESLYIEALRADVKRQYTMTDCYKCSGVYSI